MKAHMSFLQWPPDAVILPNHTAHVIGIDQLTLSSPGLLCKHKSPGALLLDSRQQPTVKSHQHTCAAPFRCTTFDAAVPCNNFR